MYTLPFFGMFRLFLIFLYNKKLCNKYPYRCIFFCILIVPLEQTPKSKIPESKGVYIFKGFDIRPYIFLRIIWKTCLGFQQHANGIRSLNVSELHLKLPLITHLLRILELWGASRLITSLVQYILT